MFWGNEEAEDIPCSTFIEKEWEILQNDNDHVTGVVRYMLSLVISFLMQTLRP